MTTPYHSHSNSTRFSTSNNGRNLTSEHLIVLVCIAILHVSLFCTYEKTRCIPSLRFVLATCLLLVDKISTTDVSGKIQTTLKLIILYVIAHFLYEKFECIFSALLILTIFDQLCVLYFLIVAGYKCYHYIEKYESA